MKLSHSPVVYILTAPHRVGKMDFPIIAVVHICHRGSHSALGHNGVSFAEQRFADKADRNAAG